MTADHAPGYSVVTEVTHWAAIRPDDANIELRYRMGESGPVTVKPARHRDRE